MLLVRRTCWVKTVKPLVLVFIVSSQRKKNFSNIIIIIYTYSKHTCECQLKIYISDKEEVKDRKKSYSSPSTTPSLPGPEEDIYIQTLD